MRQDKDQRNQKQHFPEQCQKDGCFRISKGNKSLLAGELDGKEQGLSLIHISFGMKPSVLADVAREYVGVVGKLWLQKSGIGQIRGKMQMAAGKMRTEKQFSKENEKQNGQELSLIHISYSLFRIPGIPRYHGF